MSLRTVQNVLIDGETQSWSGRIFQIFGKRQMHLSRSQKRTIYLNLTKLDYTGLESQWLVDNQSNLNW